jgi:glycosyltransferase involved in cell wall biosynthesis
MNSTEDQQADICIILEGTYPYVPGGVSNWTHDLILGMPELNFHLLTIIPPDANLKLRYTLPENITEITHITLQDLPEGRSRIPRANQFFQELESQLEKILSDGSLTDLSNILELLKPYKDKLGNHILLNSKETWEMVVQMYNAQYPASSFLDYFWSWRSLMSGFYSVLLADIPPARMYHAVSTGYAGLLAARAKIETNRPVVLTEHGIYTNERRIEISMSDWFHQKSLRWLNLSTMKKDLKDFWIDTFINYSRICYMACDKVVTLFPENQKMQIADGADPKKLEVIPNGVDWPTYSKIVQKKTSRPTIALIGRVVPIKDIKSYILACDILRRKIPNLLAYLIGPTDEDQPYFEECKEMVRFLGLEDTISFTGRVKLTDYMDQIDVNVLTSISEGQPLVILEMGAVGIPSVATNVGACEELILGSDTESPKLKPGGAIVPLSNPAATAKEIGDLLVDKNWHEQCGQAMKERIRLYYNEADLIERYRELYDGYLSDIPIPQLQEI